MKIKININHLLLLFLVITGISCRSTKTLIIDIPKPSPKELPASIQSLTLVSQVIDNYYTDISSDSLQKLFFKKQFKLDTVIYDLQMVDTTLKALGELLFESGRYDYVIPGNRFLENREKSSDAAVLPWERVEYISKTFNTDAVLSLDYLGTRVITQYDKETFFDPSLGGFFSAAKAEMKIKYEALFRIYDPLKKQILLREIISDTLFWSDSDISVRVLFSRFTPVKKALTEAGITIALELSDKIAVRWDAEKRKYFTKGSSEMRQASQLVNKGDWRSAVALWKKIIDGPGSKSLKSKAQYNIAVSYEIFGDLDKAISWALRSYNTKYHTTTYEYLEILKRRKNETSMNK